MEEKKWCVYKHTAPNGKVYIGITSNIKQRWCAMGEQYHQCKRFYYAIRKYGWINISHEILHTDLSRIEAEELEIQYISKYRTTNPKYGYNMTTGGAGVPNNSGYRRVSQYDLFGNFIKTFNTVREAAIAIGVSGAAISHICRKDKGHVSAKGYIFRYEGDSLDLDLLTRPNCKEVYQLDEYKNIICIFKSLKDASSDMKCDSSSISKAIKNGNKVYGYYWCKKSDYNNFIIKTDKSKYPKSIIQYDKKMEFIKTWKSIGKASKELGISHSGIIQVCKGRQKTAGGYIWHYADKEGEYDGKDISFNGLS